MKVLNYFDSVISLFGGKKEVLFYKSYLPPKKLIILNLSLLQFPRLYNNTFNYKYNKKIIPI